MVDSLRFKSHVFNQMWEVVNSVYLYIVSRLQFGRTPIVGTVVNTNFVNANSPVLTRFQTYSKLFRSTANQTSAMNYARAENWIRNFTNPLKNWRRHAKPGPFEAAWNRGIEHEIAGTSQTITTAHTILGLDIFPVSKLLQVRKILTGVENYLMF